MERFASHMRAALFDHKKFNILTVLIAKYVERAVEVASTKNMKSFCQKLNYVAVGMARLH